MGFVGWFGWGDCDGTPEITGFALMRAAKKKSSGAEISGLCHICSRISLNPIISAFPPQ